MSSSTLAALSVLSLIAGIILYKKSHHPTARNLLLFTLGFSSLVLLVAYGSANYFTGHGIDEATIYHLKYGLGGAGIMEYIWVIIAAVVALAGGSYLLLKRSHKAKDSSFSRKVAPYLALLLLATSLATNPGALDVYKLQQDAFVFGSSEKKAADPEFARYYKKPDLEPLGTPAKNLVFIYAESLERTYFDENLFPGLIQDLRELEAQSLSFTNIKQVTGTGWTVAGMTASQCGIPLFTPSHGNSMSGMDKFLASATCLGDLLKQQGYDLAFLGGAKLEFAGKGKLYETHGFSSVSGQRALAQRLQDKNYQYEWGLYDDSVLDMAYEEFLQRSASGEKFGIFTLTLDTHHPTGHPSKSCEHRRYKDGSNSMLNSVACSDFLISRFVRKIVDSPYAENTVIVLVSDHLAMRNTAFEQLLKGDRKNLFMIIDPSRPPKAASALFATPGSTLDIGPTILPFIGYDGNIGLGRNLLSPENKPAERATIHAKLKKWKNSITAFWSFPTITEKLAIDVANRTVSIDDRRFRAPVLIELNARLDSTLKFQFNKSSGHKSLIEHRKLLAPDDYFILVDTCKHASKIDKSMGKEGLCLLAGKGAGYSKITRLEGNLEMNVEDVKKLLGIDS